MKNPFESPETFEAFAALDYCYFALGEIMQQIQDESKASPISRMVDKVTGYADLMNQERKDAVISLLEQIIDCKKKLEHDYSRDLKFLNEVKAMVIQESATNGR